MSGKARDFFNRFRITAREVALLLKKDATERKQRKTARRNASKATAIVLGGLLVAALVFFIARFSSEFCAIPRNGEDATQIREAALLTLIYAAVFFVNLVSGIGKIYNSIANAADIRVLQVLPVRAQSVFLYKLTKLYLDTVLQNLVLLLPINVTLGIVMGNDVGFYFGTVFAAFAIPVAALFFASILSIPLNRVFDWLKNKYVILLIVFVGVIFAGFYFYYQLLKILETLLANNELQFFFNETVMNIIDGFAANAYPVNFIALMTLGIDAGTYFGIFTAITVVAGVLLYALNKIFVPKMLGRRLEGKRKFERLGRKTCSEGTPFGALLGKEALIVFRTPSYAFQYFAVAALLPMMCYLTIGIVTRLLKTVVQSDSGYEIAVFVVAMFALLTNTFAATNVSRDNKMFAFCKTLPVTGGKILAAKILFCYAVSVVSIAVSVAALAAAEYVNVGEAFGVFAFVAILSFSQILVATRLDLNRPSFPAGEDSEVEESSSASAVALTGLAFAVLVGAVLIALSLVVSVRNLGEYRPLIIGLASAGIAAAALGASLLYFFRGLKKRYREGV